MNVFAPLFLGFDVRALPTIRPAQCEAGQIGLSDYIWMNNNECF